MLKKGLIISAFATLLTSGCDGGSIANNAKTGGTLPMAGGTLMAGGVTATTGGVTTSTGGVTAATGGVIAAMGGMTAVMGGTIAATGGGIAATGGVATATGGTTPATGGLKATGGTATATGGTAIATGGIVTPTGGIATSTGGVLATGGTRTGGMSPDAGVAPSPDTASPDTTTDTGGGACIPAAAAATLKKNHNAGKDCISCHSGDGIPTTVAGTVYDSAGTAAVAGATVTITGSNGAVIKLVTASSGNFYTNSAVVFPAKVEVSKCPDTAKMVKTITNGSCNSSSCHGASMRITLP